jgi:molecular chaperone HtpG
MPLYGIINDPGVLGIRIRVKNLQLDGSEIIARILQRHAPSYARFASWHLGEIYIDGESAIPNARRDGFEDSPGWRAIEGQIADALLPLVKGAYEASGTRSSKVFGKVNEDVSREIKEIETALAESATAPSPDRKAIGRNIRGALKRIDNLKLDDYTDKQQRALREATVKLRNLAEQASVKIAPSKPKPQPEQEEDEVPYREFLDIVFEVINPLLDTRTFNKVRKALVERFKDI